MSKTSYTVTTENGAGERLDLFLSRRESAISRTKAQTLIDEGGVEVDARKRSASYKLSLGEIVTWTPPEAPRSPHDIEPVAMPLEILHEDEDILVINKRAGISVHPGAGTKGPTLLHGLLAYTKELSRLHETDSEVFRPGIVHRLDKDTSGVMVVAKNDSAHDHLAKQFSRKKLRRQYIAVCKGSPRFERKMLVSYLTRDKSDRRKFKSVNLTEYKSLEDAGSLHGKYRKAESYFWVEKKFSKQDLRLVNVRITTGRTHQIRVHAQALGLAILGDALYGCENTFFPQVTGQMLHAWILEFVHPRTEEIVLFEAPLPESWKDAKISFDDAVSV